MYQIWVAPERDGVIQKIRIIQGDIPTYPEAIKAAIALKLPDLEIWHPAGYWLSGFRNYLGHWMQRP